MFQKFKEDKRLRLAVILAAAVVLALVILLVILLGGNEEGNWSLAGRPGPYGDWSWETNAAGETVFPTDEEGEIVFPTNSEGREVLPTDKDGETITPTDDQGKPVRPTNPGDETVPTLPPDVTINVQDPNFVEPGAGSLRVEEITGFTPVQVDKSAMKNEDGSDYHGSGDIGHAGILTDDPNLVLEYVGRYNGSFVEDGSDDPVANCLSVILTNNSEKTLQIASLTLLVNGQDEASFVASNVAPGASVMVMESTRREYQKGDQFTLESTAVGFLDEASLMKDKFQITGEDGKLTVTNLTKESYEKIYVYYKYIQLGGAYLGGITYRVPVENLGPGETVEVVAGHWQNGSSRLSMVEIVS